jgi:hypothetical protein
MSTPETWKSAKFVSSVNAQLMRFVLGNVISHLVSYGIGFFFPEFGLSGPAANFQKSHLTVRMITEILQDFGTLFCIIQRSSFIEISSFTPSRAADVLHM